MLSNSFLRCSFSLLLLICSFVAFPQNASDVVSSDSTSSLVDSTNESTAESVRDRFCLSIDGEMIVTHGTCNYNLWNGDGKFNKNWSALSFVVGGEYACNKWLQLYAEIAVDAGGIDWIREPSARLMSQESRGCEVGLEQLHLTIPFARQFQTRVGYVVVPVGLTNSSDDYIYHFGALCPKAETCLIPSTWNETGVEFFGSVGKGFAEFDYQFQMVSGLDAEGVDKYGFLADSDPEFFNGDVFSTPAFVARVDYNGLPGLRIGSAFYYCSDIGAEGGTIENSANIPVRVFSADAMFSNSWVVARANFLKGYVGNSNGLYSKDVEDQCGVAFAMNAVSYGTELGFNIGRFVTRRRDLRVYPFARYEYYNPQEKISRLSVDAGLVPDSRCQVSSWTLGIDWHVSQNIVFKADWTTRHVGNRKLFCTSDNYSPENNVSFSVAFVDWKVKR